MIRRILVVLAGTRFTPSAIRFAVDLAERHGAFVTGLAVLDRRRLERVGPVPAGGLAYAERLRDHRLTGRQGVLAAAAQVFREVCTEAGVSHRVVQEEGDTCEAVVSRSRYHDLTVFGLGGALECQRAGEVSDTTLARLVGGGMRPLLAVADDARPVRRVIVAYSGSVDSARAMRCFVHLRPWSEVQVRLVTCHPSEREGSRLLAEATEYWRAHGWEPETRWIPGPPGRGVVAEADRWDADLVVAGSGARSLVRCRHVGETALYFMRHGNRPLLLGP